MKLRNIVCSATLLILASQAQAGTDVMIADATWKATNVAPPVGWNSSLAFDDSSWTAPVANPGGIVLNGDPTFSLWFDGDPCSPASFSSWFRTVFNLSLTPNHARLSMGVDDDAQVFVNGNLVIDDQDGTFSHVPDVDVAPYLVSGMNLIAVQATDTAGGCHGFSLRLAVSDSCGNATIDSGEDCDDGNLSNGDCCSADCQAEVGNACTDGDPCTVNQCNENGTCGAAPTGCKGPAKSMLLLKKHSSDDASDKLIWKWLKGESTETADFGTPVGGTEHILCLASGSASAYVAISPGSSWEEIGTKGFKFKSTASPGPQKAILKSGGAGRAKAILLAKGSGPTDALLMPTMDLPVTARLINNSTNACFEAVYQQGDVIKNEDGSFKAKAQ